MQVRAYDANKQEWGFLCFVLTPGSDDLRNASSWILGKVMDLLLLSNHSRWPRYMPSNFRHPAEVFNLEEV